ncbi:MAG TPA: hypothetical protein VE954_31485 [Oligoflexus sp.]|uniref:hypothetical protein n=1 Tax=Oligoflexus sp. TaxID=1971216 RepID=UPI002D5D5677|nr:hypothetical protein [Oligoflexus sp.]HYX37648.1 hypothetical protein [Oligoflexus sp.]
MSKLSDVLKQNRGLIYRGIVKQIKSGEGYGFHNNDQGHPVLGTEMAQIPDAEKYKANFGMFSLASSLARDLIEEDDDIVGTKDWVDLSTWDKFRDFATKAYRDRRS